MKVSQIQNIPSSSIVSSEILKGYTLGMKNVFPDDKVPVYELDKFPISAYISDIDPNTTKNLVTRLRKLNSDVEENKVELQNLASQVRTITSEDVEKAKLQPSEDALTYNEVTSQLMEKFASPEEFQNAVNNVYTYLFKAIEEMMVQAFTTSMYARQYNAIYDDVEIDIGEWEKEHGMDNT